MRYKKKFTWLLTVCQTAGLALLPACSPDNSDGIFESLAAVLGQDNNQTSLQTPSVPDSSEPVVTIPGDFGLSGPEAIVVVPDSGQSRYKSIEIRFSQSMNLSSVESAMSVTDSLSNPLPTNISSNPGGTFRWVSPRRVFFDPYKELKENETYSIEFDASALTTGGESLTVDTRTHSLETLPSFTMTHQVNGLTYGGNGIAIDSNSVSTVTLSSTLTNHTLVDSVELYQLGNATAIEICSPCTSGSFSTNLTTSAIPPITGGNQYYYAVHHSDGQTEEIPLSFNYGPMSSNPAGLQTGVASAVLDNAHLMPLVSAMLERFAKADFELNNKTFNEFASNPKTSVKRSGCIDYGSVSFIESYGNGPGAAGKGYCGFFIEDGASFLGTSDVVLDVYVTNIYLAPTVNGGRNLDISMFAQNASPDELAARLEGRKIVLDLAIIGRLESGIGCIIICTVPAGTKLHFSAVAELNPGASSPAKRLSQSRGIIASNSAGELTLTIKTPYTPTDTITQNFYVQPWVDNIDVHSINREETTSWVADLLSSITESIAEGLVPQVQPLIVQAILGDFKQRIAPNVLNAFLGSIRDDGVQLGLPDYLPTPLDQMSLDLKLKIGENPNLSQVSGSSAGLVSTADVGITATNSCGGCSRPGTMLGSHSFIATRSSAPSTSHIFTESATKPGLSLALHEDAINQAMFHLWKEGALNLTIDSAFLNDINSYAGNNQLLRLTDSLLNAGTILTVIAPGAETVQSLDASNNLVTIDTDEDVRLVVRPKLAPNIRLAPHTTAGVPEVLMDLGDLVIRIETVAGSRRLATLKIHAVARGQITVQQFSNPDSVAGLDNLSALSVQLDPELTYYIIEVQEGSTANPYGLDPNAVQQVADPLVKSFVIPLLNNILREIPLPRRLAFPAFTTPGGDCSLKLNRDELMLNLEPVPPSYPYIYARLHATTAVYNPGVDEPRAMGNLIECP